MGTLNFPGVRYVMAVLVNKNLLLTEKNEQKRLAGKKQKVPKYPKDCRNGKM